MHKVYRLYSTNQHIFRGDILRNAPKMEFFGVGRGKQGEGHADGGSTHYPVGEAICCPCYAVKVTYNILNIK